MSSVIRNFVNSSQRTVMPDPNEVIRTAPVVLPDPPTLEVEVKDRNKIIEKMSIPWFNKNVETLKDRSAIFYGPSGTGKTVLIYDFMYKARHIFPRVMVFAPTNREKRDYEGIIPKELVYEEFGLDDIKTIYETQKAAAHTYNTANDIKVLQQIFNRISTEPQKHYVKNVLLRQKLLAEQEIKRNYTEIGSRKDRLEKLETMFKDKLRAFYKERVIAPNIAILRQMPLSNDERLAVKYLNYNPRILIVFDDAMTELMTLIKKGKHINESVILEFFYKGRWAYITHFYAFQDDNRLDSEIKKNAFFSIFTSSNVATAFFGRGATNFSKLDQLRAAAAIKEIFSDDEDSSVPKHHKLVYNRMDSKHPFQYTKADLHDEFNMCSKAVRTYCEKIAKEEDLVDKNNPYLKRFADF